MPTLKTSSESYERDIDSMQFALDRHIFGSVDDVRRRVDEFIENGVQHFELKIIYPTMDSLHRQMDLWAETFCRATTEDWSDGVMEHWSIGSGKIPSLHDSITPM